MRISATVKKLINETGIDVSTLSDNTLKAYATGMKQYREFLKKKRLADNLKSGKSWLVSISKSKSPATYNLRAQALRFYFEHKYSDDSEKLWEVQTLKGRNARMALACYSENYLTEEQILILMESMTKRMALICRALFWTGCRISELINIRLKDMQPARPGIAIPITITGKGKKVRQVYLPHKLAEDIMHLFRGKKYLFETREKKPYNRSQIYKDVSNQAKKIGMKAYPHKFRHSKAMYLKDVKELSADQVAKALGHADVSTTLKCYYHGTPSAVDQGM